MTITENNTAALGEDDPSHTSSHDRLLDAAIYIAGTAGLDKVTYRSVGDRAGMSHSLVRFYFGSRDEMLARAFERAARRDADEGHLLSNDIESFAGELITTTVEHPERSLLQYDFLLHAVRGNGSVPDVVALYDHYIEQISGTLRNVGIDDPDESIGRLVLAALDGLVLQHAAYQSIERTTAMLQQLRRMLSALRTGGHDEP